MMAFMNHGTHTGAQILRPETVAQMLAMQDPGFDEKRRLAWARNAMGGRNVVGHSGREMGTVTAAWFDPEKSIAVIVFANGDDATHHNTKRFGAKRTPSPESWNPFSTIRTQIRRLAILRGGCLAWKMGSICIPQRAHFPISVYRAIPTQTSRFFSKSSTTLGRFVWPDSDRTR